MKVFRAKFSGHYLGGHAVIVAEDVDEAIEVLNLELDEEGLYFNEEEDEIEEVYTDSEACYILFNGDY